MKQRARQAGKANEQRLTEIVWKVLDETEHEAVVTKAHVRALTDEVVAALVAAGAFVPEPKDDTKDQPAQDEIVIEAGTIVITTGGATQYIPPSAQHLARQNVSRHFH